MKKRMLSIIISIGFVIVFSANCFALSYYGLIGLQSNDKRIKQIFPNKYGYNCAAITYDDELYLWGNSYSFGWSKPQKILDNTVSVTVGDNCSGAITKNGDLYMWGNNYGGQLGDGTAKYSGSPIKVLENAVSLSIGCTQAAAITSDGSLYIWGGNYDEYGMSLGSYPAKVLDNVAGVSLGYNHGGAVTKDGSLYMWGDNSYGQLGKDESMYSDVPIKIMDNVATVCLGYYSTAAITFNNELYTWGICSGREGNNRIPEKIMDNVSYVTLVGEEYYSGFNGAAITTSGELYTWGSNSNGKLGNGTSELIDWDRLFERDEDKYYEISGVYPVKVMDNVALVSMGVNHCLAVTNDGNLYLWGDNQFGQLGNGKYGGEYIHFGQGLWKYNFEEEIDSAVPIKVMDNIASAAVGYTFSTAISKNGDVFSWGDNEYGQLGNGKGGGDSFNYDEGIDSIYPEKIVLIYFTPGDVNNDGKVTLEDAVQTLKRAMNVDVGNEAFTEEAADVVADGKISLEDAIEILKMAMKVTS